MAVVLRFQIIPSQNCKSFFFQETTGDYNVSTNPTGWGGANEDIATITDATLAITKRDGSILTLGAANNFYPLFPNTNDSLFEITNELLGLDASEDITDWIAYFTYTCVGNNTYATSLYVPILCQSECCIATLSSEVRTEGDCDCDNKGLSTFSDAYDLSQVIQNSLTDTCQKPTKAATLLDQLTNICASNGCGC